MKNIILAIALLMTVGCTTVEYKYKYVEVEVPVAVAVTPPPKFKKVDLPIAKLTKKDNKNYPKISKAYAITIKILKKELEKRDVALDKYRPKKEIKK